LLLSALTVSLGASGDPALGTTGITSVSPPGGAAAGALVTITGNGFVGTTGVWFGVPLHITGSSVTGGTPAPDFQIGSDNTLYAHMPANEPEGLIVVCSPTGCAASDPYGPPWQPIASPVGSAAWTIWRVGAGKGQLVVQNTGFEAAIDKLTWTPPAGVRVTRMSSSRGGTCTLAGNVITCVAALLPPHCRQRGAKLTARFAYAGGLSASPGWVRAAAGSTYGWLKVMSISYTGRYEPCSA
jgi:hypothetical protein